MIREALDGAHVHRMVGESGVGQPLEGEAHVGVDLAASQRLDGGVVSARHLRRTQQIRLVRETGDNRSTFRRHAGVVQQQFRIPDSRQVQAGLGLGGGITTRRYQRPDTVDDARLARVVEVDRGGPFLAREHRAAERLKDALVLGPVHRGHSDPQVIALRVFEGLNLVVLVDEVGPFRRVQLAGPAAVGGVNLGRVRVTRQIPHRRDFADVVPELHFGFLWFFPHRPLEYALHLLIEQLEGGGVLLCKRLSYVNTHQSSPFSG
ncbi:hypothetical protein ES708_26822 [subsurface metagenome]